VQWVIKAFQAAQQVSALQDVSYEQHYEAAKSGCILATRLCIDFTDRDKLAPQCR
jgi:hypothetical protein